MLKIRVCSQVLKFTRYTIQYDWEGVGDYSGIWGYLISFFFESVKSSLLVK